MYVEKITPLPDRGRGWARVPFKECEAPSAIKSMAIVRRSHMASYLGRMGWQISESRLPLSVQVTGDSEFTLLLQPEVVQHLEVGNYEFLFFDHNAQQLHSLVLRWAGVTYRAPGGEISPIEIIQPDVVSKDQTIIVSEGEKGGIAKPAESEGVVSGTSVPGFSTAWTGIPQPDAPQSLPSMAPPPHLPPLPPISPPDPISTYDRKEVRRIRCMNQSCCAEILDSMIKCPFCSSPRSGGDPIKKLPAGINIISGQS